MNRYRFFSLCLGLMCGLHLSAKDYYATDFGVKADGTRVPFIKESTL